MNMKKLLIIITFLFIPSLAFSDAGVVVKEDVCGSGNSIIETNDGWFIAAEHYSGVYLYEGDVVYGKMKAYGFQILTRKDGKEGKFYIEDYESDIGDAYEELCE